MIDSPYLWGSVEEIDNRRNHCIGCFFHQPMSRARDNLASDIRCYQINLFDEKVAAGLLAGQDQHRHGKTNRTQLGEVLSVPLEVAEVLETGSHASGLRVCLCIDSAVGLGYRVFWIRSEVVPEVLEVGPLATLDQRQRHVAIEVEVPEVAHQPDLLPVADAGQEGIHQHHALGG